MTMQEHLDACKRRAFELKATHPDLKHTKRLKLTAKAVFTPAGKAPVAVLKTFTLKR